MKYNYQAQRRRSRPAGALLAAILVRLLNFRDLNPKNQHGAKEDRYALSFCHSCLGTR